MAPELWTPGMTAPLEEFVTRIVRRAGAFSIVSLVASDNAAAAAVLRDVLIGDPPE